MSLRDDIRIIHSEATFAHVIDRLHELIRERGLTLFAEIDHARNARDAGLEMPDTALMLASPDVALELPLRILVRSEDEGRTALVYIDPGRLTAEFGIPDLASSIVGLSAIAQAAATAVRA